jgi:hypothetical protein
LLLLKNKTITGEAKAVMDISAAIVIVEGAEFEIIQP